MCAMRVGSGATGAAAGSVLDDGAAVVDQRAPVVEQISDQGPLPVAGIISRDSVGASASPNTAINARRKTSWRRCLKKFTARV